MNSIDQWTMIFENVDYEFLSDELKESYLQHKEWMAIIEELGEEILKLIDTRACPELDLFEAKQTNKSIHRSFLRNL